MHDASNHSTPTLAVAICTRDRASALAETLSSIWPQTRPPHELIIIDDGRMADDVPRRIGQRCKALSIDFKFRRNPAPGLTRARNLAADIASSDVLLYLDDDVTCDSCVVEEIARLMTDPNIAGATATVEEPAFNSFSARLYQNAYRFAGWWRVAPRKKRKGPAPAVLARRDIAIPTQWLSGAAMALRRDIVRANRFDETLTGYGLGEDREMSYRLLPRHWLVQSKRARVLHRREPSQRADDRRLGFMTSFNYLHILRKTCQLGAGDWLLIVWSLAILAAMHGVWALFGDRAGHVRQFLGIVDGAIAAFRGNADFEIRSSECSAKSPGAHIPHFEASSAKLFWRAGAGRRILFITNRLEPGGAERMLLGLVKHLPRHGIDPFVLCLKDGGPLASQCRDIGVPVFEKTLRFKLDAAVIPRIRRIIREQGIDLLVVAHSGGDRMFWSTLAARLDKTPIIVWSHWFPMSGRRHFEYPNRALFRWIDAYVALGRSHRQALIRHENVPAGRVRVIPNALDLAPFIRAVPRRDIRRRLRLTEDQIAVAIVANLRPEKRHDIFIEAARRLALANRRLRFLVVGDGPHRDAVQAAAATSGLDHETLRLLGPRDDVPELLSGVDICCLCSEIECFSVTMLEAAAAGCAFIGPNVGCLPEFLEHRRNGLLIRPADVASLADAVEELAADAALRRAFADEARTKVMRDYGLENMAGAFADLFFAVSAKCECGAHRAERGRRPRRVCAPGTASVPESRR